jgi:hypothetical protein
VSSSSGPGRNKPCPCGSGRKFKRCCLGRQRSAAELARISGALESGRCLLTEHLHAEQVRRDKFGEVRPVIHADHKGYKFVAVGSQLLYSKHWRTFPDFLGDYIKRVLTPEWGKAELAKPLQERHVVMQWYDGMCQYQRRQQRDPNGLYGAVPNGPWRAYMLLAYDLYSLQHHSTLQAAVVKRLKHPDQFQGARHELFAAATCIRAGYDIEYEDEGDSSRRHPELVALHRATGQKIAVEAKSRHRPGVLGRPGHPQPTDGLRAGIERLLKDALAKPVCHPYVIFFDLNVPPFRGHPFQAPWFEEVGDSVAKIGDAHGGSDPFNLIVFSNQPDHYLNVAIPSPGGTILLVLGRNPQIPAANESALAAVHQAAQKFGRIPNSFEEADGTSPSRTVR